ncbi:MAG: hypothetical protein JXR60_11770 [Bacteroidales bacterium]|nr:hypothetical protein [Bacteroidales bacterium]
MRIWLNVFLVFISSVVHSQDVVPSVYPEIQFENKQGFSISLEDKNFFNKESYSYISWPAILGSPEGTGNGIQFSFLDEKFSGAIKVGYRSQKNPLFIDWYEKEFNIFKGKANINLETIRQSWLGITRLHFNEDELIIMVLDRDSSILYIGNLAYQYKGFYKVKPTLIGSLNVRFFNDSLRIDYKTFPEVFTEIQVGTRHFQEIQADTDHKFQIPIEPNELIDSVGLKINGRWQYYQLKFFDNNSSVWSFSLANSNFRNDVMPYWTDSLLFNSLNYSVKNKDKFCLIVGSKSDSTSSQLQNKQLQYYQFQNYISPFTVGLQCYYTMGENDRLFQTYNFDSLGRLNLDKFPFATESSEAVFLDAFNMPYNGPMADDSILNSKKNWPPYKGSTYWFKQNNVAIVVLNPFHFSSENNTAYFFSGNQLKHIDRQQLLWLEKTMKTIDIDSAIQHVFIVSERDVYSDSTFYKTISSSSNNKLKCLVSAENNGFAVNDYTIGSKQLKHINLGNVFLNSSIEIDSKKIKLKSKKACFLEFEINQQQLTLIQRNISTNKIEYSLILSE